jgi:Bifunctional DNA primase/polymerase, N-terminal/Primase C terminal 1 (PriCT-1)
MRARLVTSGGIFTKWQPHYAERRIATFPVGNDKKPQIRRWNQLGLTGSAKLAQRFTESNAFGFQPGPRSRVTVLDVDTHDENILSDALSEHGETPFIVRTGGGYHAYYRHNGERRHIRPFHEKPIDILGGGFIVAPPSIAEKGTYQLIAGTLDDLANLPPIHLVLDKLRAEARIYAGTRNDTLFILALEQARYADEFDALLDAMRTRNMDCEPQMPDADVVKVAQSAWRYEQEGRNLIGRGRSLVTTHSLIDELIGESQDAFILFTLLRRHHWGRDFVAANAMADQLGWTRKRFAEARGVLVLLGLIEEVIPAGYRTPAVFKFGVRGGQI